MFRRILPEEYEVVEEYTVEGRAVRIIESEGELYYDIEIPELNFFERKAAEEILSGSYVDLDKLGGIDKEKVLTAVKLYKGLGEVEYLIADGNLTDIFIYQNGIVEVVHLKYGDLDTTLRLAEPEKFASRLRLLTNRQFDYSKPLLSYFHKRYRISAVGYSATPSQKIDIAIRIWHEKPLSILDLLRFGSINEEIASLLTILANLGCSIIIAGDRGGGKSTLLQALLFLVPKKLRKVCILTEREIHEYFYENDFRITDFKVHLGKEVSHEGVPLEDAVKQMLIHGESGYIIYNEIKFKEEAELFFTTCAIAGYSSILTTMHADSPEGILQRLILDFKLPMEALRNINFILMAQVVRRGFSAEKYRRVTRLTEIRSFREDPLKESKLYDLFSFDVKEFRWDINLNRILSSEVLNRKLKARGLTKDDFTELYSALTEIYRKIRGYSLERFVEFINIFFKKYEAGMKKEEILEVLNEC